MSKRKNKNRTHRKKERKKERKKVTPRNTGCQGTNKLYLLLVDFRYCQFKDIKRNDLKGPRFNIRYWRISVTLRSGIAGFKCMW